MQIFFQGVATTSGNLLSCVLTIFSFFTAHICALILTLLLNHSALATHVLLSVLLLSAKGKQVACPV